MSKILAAHFWPVTIIALVVFLVVIALSVWLFRDLMTNPDGTRRAMRAFVGFIRGLRGAVKGDPAPAIDPLAQTISQPVKAPLNPLAPPAAQPTSSTTAAP